MTESKLSIAYLHSNPEYLQQSVDLLNKQWSRSSSARSQSLEKSYKDLPDSVLLIEKGDSEERVIGHSRLTRILEDISGCWIGSVVISEEKRNKGYGKYLMNKSEEYAKKLNFSTAYLNTQDKQGFYEHLGYQYCEPVSSISFKSHALLFKGSFSASKSVSNNIRSIPKEEEMSKNNKNMKCFEDEKLTNIVNIPPPPPPLPVIIKPKNSLLKTNLGQHWMKKTL